MGGGTQVEVITRGVVLSTSKTKTIALVEDVLVPNSVEHWGTPGNRRKVFETLGNTR